MAHSISDKPAPHLYGTAVRAYCDLHRKVSSVQALKGEAKGKVIAKPRCLVLRSVELKINPAGQRRCRLEKVRNVHAFAYGEIAEIESSTISDHPDAVPIRYNPHLFDCFVRGDSLVPIKGADFIAIDGKRAWGLGLIYKA